MAVLETDKKKSSQLSLMVASDVSVHLPYAELSWYKVVKRTILSFSCKSTLFYNRNYLVYYSAMQLLLQCSMQPRGKLSSTNQKPPPRCGLWHVCNMQFLRSFLRLHFAGKLVVASQNDGWFLRLCVVQRLITHVSTVSTSNFLRITSFSRFYLHSNMYSITTVTDIIVYPPLPE